MKWGLAAVGAVAAGVALMMLPIPNSREEVAEFFAGLLILASIVFVVFAIGSYRGTLQLRGFRLGKWGVVIALTLATSFSLYHFAEHEPWVFVPGGCLFALFLYAMHRQVTDKDE